MDPEAPEHSREAVTTTTTAIPLPISAVRLVHPLTDPATGRTRDVIIRHLRHGRVFVDKVTGRREWTRVVPGLGITIPWPNEEDSPTPDPTRNAKEYPGADTLRIDVEERTFVPTLLRPPMPPAVIDELRNRYSVFRTRHDPEYIARKEAEWGAADAARAARNGRGVVVPPEMRTPLMELHLKEKAERKQRPEPVLTEEMLEKIGAVIARSMEEKSKTPPDNNLSEDQEPRPSPPS